MAAWQPIFIIPMYESSHVGSCCVPMCVLRTTTTLQPCAFPSYLIRERCDVRRPLSGLIPHQFHCTHTHISVLETFFSSPAFSEYFCFLNMLLFHLNVFHSLYWPSEIFSFKAFGGKITMLLLTALENNLFRGISTVLFVFWHPNFEPKTLTEDADEKRTGGLRWLWGRRRGESAGAIIPCQ